MSNPIKVWAVMKAHPMTAISTTGISLSWPKDGPDFFIAVFKDREKAVAWCDGDGSAIVEMERAGE